MSTGERVLAIMLAAVVLVLAAGMIYALWLIGAETARLLAMVLVGGVLLVALVWASQFPLRAWRSNQQPERHIYHERVREVHHVPVPDARLPQLPQLPTYRSPEAPAYPELMRSLFLAGQIGAGSPTASEDEGQNNEQHYS